MLVLLPRLSSKIIVKRILLVGALAPTFFMPINECPREVMSSGKIETESQSYS